MVKMRYIGLSNAMAEFQALSPYVAQLDRMKLAYPPASPEYRALDHARGTIQLAAEFVTKQPFWRAMDTGVIGKTRPPAEGAP